MLIRSQKGSALIISLIVLTLITVMSTVFFEKILRFSQASEGIENSNIAYYKALWSIENSLYGVNVNKYTPWNIVGGHTGWTYANSWSDLTVTTGSSIVPAPGKWNSPYDSNYNIIGIGEPVQLVIPQGIEWNSVAFRFRIPQINPTSSTGIAVWAGAWSGYILWTFASSGASLFASGETNIFEGDVLNNTSRYIATEYWVSNSGSSLQFRDFYTDAGFLWPAGTKCTNYQCTLKLSLIRTVPTTDTGRSVSFLEYKIDFNGVQIPSQYMNLSAEWYAYGFLRRRDFQFPQITTNTALDFAVLQ